MFGSRKNSFRMDGVYDFTDSFAKDIKMFMLSYSQPNRFFRLQGRRNMHLVAFVGTSKGVATPAQLSRYPVNNDENISQLGIGLSQEAVFWNAKKFYIGAGAGPFVKQYKNDFLASQFMFGFRAFAGVALGRFNAELGFQHFSDGHLTELNHGINAFGIGVSYNF
jgi:hypothetical protein